MNPHLVNLAVSVALGNMPVMPEDGCSMVKTEMVPIAGRAQPRGGSCDAFYSA
jgi:hypothetical protein